MQDVHQSARARAKRAVALMLTFSAGMVDIVGYIALYHWFVAHMTGNTVHLGSELVAGKWDEAAKAATVIASFVIASIIGRAIIQAGARKQLRSVASITLLAEAALIAAFIWTKPLFSSCGGIPLRAVLPLLAVLAAAMGLQTATLTRIGPLTIHTTFVTGMLNKFAQAVSEWLFWLYDQMKARRGWHGSTRQRTLRNAEFMGLIWVHYMVGAVVGTWLYSRWNVSALYIPVMLLMISVGVDQLRPLSIEEEKDQEQA